MTNQSITDGGWEEEFDELFPKGYGEIGHKHNENCEWVCSKHSHIKSFIRTQISEAVERKMRELAYWIDNNVGVSSEAIYLYMTLGKVPAPFDAPSDSGDRGRCVVLLQAVPEWIPRLKEIEDLELCGTSNGKKVFPWNEQIPLIRRSLKDTSHTEPTYGYDGTLKDPAKIARFLTPTSHTEHEGDCPDVCPKCRPTTK